jgi:osmotically-inducible protein OsmY
MRSKRVAGWVLAGLACCGCDGQDTERLARVGRLVADKADRAATGSAQPGVNGWQSLRATRADVGLDARVLARLRWDKELAGSAVEVQPAGEGKVRLTGSVADSSQRGRAVRLARATLGVEEVIDELTVEGK